MPENDEWTASHGKAPCGAEISLHGAWVRRKLPFAYREMDIYLGEIWEKWEKEREDAETEAMKAIDSYFKSDYEIGLNINITRLKGEGAADYAKKMSEYAVFRYQSQEKRDSGLSP